MAGLTLIDPASLKQVRKLPTDADSCLAQIVPDQQAVWLLTSDGLARMNPVTAATEAAQPGFDPGAGSLADPAVTVDRQGRIWLAHGSGLDVLEPDSLTLHQVGQSAGAVSVVTEGPGIWIDTGTSLVQLDVHAPRAAVDQFVIVTARGAYTS